jgi:mono/diheme cytochrome c family protein
MAMYTEERVSDAQLGDIWDWLDSFPLPSTPEERYEDYCANCHGADGRGGPTGSGLVAATDAVFHASVRGGHGGQVFSRRAEYMPAYDESVLTEEQILEIATYIRSR